MSISGRLLRRSRLGARLKAVLALYVVAAALMPLGHHDFVCHLTSTTHCTTCTVGCSAEAAGDPAVLARFWLLDAGATAVAPSSSPDAAPVRALSGRAPPAIG
jgi:hypothetical protein